MTHKFGIVAADTLGRRITKAPEFDVWQLRILYGDGSVARAALTIGDMQALQKELSELLAGQRESDLQAQDKL